MRVLYFHQHFCTPKGSSGIRSYQMARALIAHGHHVTMVCGSYSRSGQIVEGEAVKGIRRGMVDGIEVIELVLPYSNYDSFLKRTGTFLRFARKSCRLALKEDYDLLFATSTPLTAGLPGIAMKVLRRKKPFVFEVRDLWPELPKAMGVIRNPVVLWAMGALEKLTYRAADGCIGLSPGIVEGIRKRSRPDLPVTMVPNGSDLDLFRPSRDAPPPAFNERHPLRAVFTGAHGMANGLHAVLDAAKVLKEKGHREIVLEFIGDGKLKPELEQRAREEDLSNCQFTGLIPKEALAERLATADVGLMILANVPAFYFGTSPNKFFDYIAAGLPVLNNYPGWLAEMITAHQCGIAVPPDNPEAFAEALIALTKSPKRLWEMGTAARTLAETQFNRETLASDFRHFLEKQAALDE